MDVISDDPGRTDLVEHEIETENASPIRLSPYRLPHATHEYLREEVKSLLTMRIIMPSKSPWATPVELVSKKDGSKRLCMDYRKLNIITRADPYPIPRVEDLIDDIGRTKYITALDLTKGYWQVPVAKSSQDKTAFITPWGKYQFRIMPFGLVAAPSTFQRLMDMILEGTHSYAAAYLDDVIIHSNTWDEHLAHLQEVFQRLRDAGLTIKEGKCKFACNKCTYLDHTVGQGQVHPLVAKVRAVQEYTQPKTKKDVRAFLGLCGYYCRFVPNFATIATPLTNLTKKDRPNVVEWDDLTQHAFEWLKDSLSNYLILSTPIWSKPFILQTDASDTGIGFVLSQKDELVNENPIAYGSRKLLARETHYSTIEKEALAIVEGTRHFQVYLEGIPFTIETDHNPLTHMARLKDSHGRLARWALAMQPYWYTIVHNQGENI